MPRPAAEEAEEAALAFARFAVLDSDVPGRGRLPVRRLEGTTSAGGD